MGVPHDTSVLAWLDLMLILPCSHSSSTLWPSEQMTWHTLSSQKLLVEPEHSRMWTFEFAKTVDTRKRMGRETDFSRVMVGTEVYKNKTSYFSLITVHIDLMD